MEAITGQIRPNVSSLAAARPKKRLFILLLALSVAFVGVLSYGAWRIGRPGLAELNRLLPSVMGAALAAVVAIGALCVINLILAVKNLPTSALIGRHTYALINLLFPLTVRLGKLFGVTRRQLEGSFIAVSNLLFARRNVKVPAKRLLVITPHCLQLASCPHKITRDPNNCKRCGGCNIGDLMKLSEELGFKFLVATGGTLARQMVKEARPKAVLAIAC